MRVVEGRFLGRRVVARDGEQLGDVVVAVAARDREYLR